jgi:hypothetical protein
MGIGIWHEMFISDPVAFLFKNSDPRGSLSANVSNSAVRCLSNMPLAEMMVNRHTMSDNVRNEVSPKSHEWGYKLGSIYIRKVHFRDLGMIRQIESKVVNRLRQVTSAIKQDGANQVSIITSTAERQAAVEFAKAAAIRPEIVGEALQKISQDPEVAEAMFEILETQKVIGSNARLTVLPRGGELLAHGPGPQGQGWSVGIQDPGKARGVPLQQISLRNEALATSGNYIQQDGATNHLIDPRTRRPVAHDTVSVSVVAPDGTTADAWATALMVLGEAKGRPVADREGLEALFLRRSTP